MKTGFAVFAFLASTFLVMSIEGNHRISSVRYTARRLDKTFLDLGQPVTWKSTLNTGFQRIDLVILLDRSGSVGKNNFKLAKKFIERMLGFFSISPSTTRVALIPFATHAKPEFKFDDNVNRECVIKALRKVKYTGGSTATGRALQESLKLFKETKSRAAKTKTKRVVFILTDGEPNIGVKPYRVVKWLKSRKYKAEVYAFGIGYVIDAHDLRNMASSWRYIFRVKKYGQLKGVIDESQLRPYTSCNGLKKVQYDECGRKCTCKNGVLINCYRIRKDFTSMSPIERKRYVHAYITISTKEPFRTKYRKLVTMHQRFFNTRIHKKDHFLPWHRWFILELENLLREVDCRLALSYWDWSLWSQDPWSKSPKSVWHNSDQGFGGDGVSKMKCVGTGPFRSSVWRTTNGTCLTRNFTGLMPDAAEVQFCLDLTPAWFEGFLRINLHDLVHCLVGGVMCTEFSAEAPEFFLHHGFVDKIWADWQKRSAVNRYAYFLNVNQNLKNSKLYPRDMINISKQPGCVKVRYAEPTYHHAKYVKKFLNGLSIKSVTKLKRRPFSRLNVHVFNMFEVPNTDRKIAVKLQQVSTKGVRKGTGRKLKGGSKVLGFKLKKPTSGDYEEDDDDDGGDF